MAVASKFPAVGAVIPWARAGVGAVATQSWANTSFGPAGLDLMTTGLSARESLDRLLADDDDRAQRQVGSVDSAGRPATFTGDRCMDWAGGRSGNHHASQGNILVGEKVVTEMSLPSSKRKERLVIDDHPEAVDELARVFEAYDREMLIRNDPLLEATPDLVSELQRRLAALDRYRGDPDGAYDANTRAAIEAFAGEYNLEGKVRDDELIYESLVPEIRDITPETDP